MIIRWGCIRTASMRGADKVVSFLLVHSFLDLVNVLLDERVVAFPPMFHCVGSGYFGNEVVETSYWHYPNVVLD